MEKWSKTKAGEVTASATKIMDRLDEQIDYCVANQGKVPGRLILERSQIDDLYDEEYDRAKLSYRHIPVVDLSEVTA